MARKSVKVTAVFDIGLVIMFGAMLAVIVNKQAFAPGVHTAVLFAVMLAATVLGWWREARKETQLDELELAGASFGARWSVAVVGFVAVLLLFVSPLQDAIVWFAQAYESNDGRPLPVPVGVFIVGFVLAMMLQLGARSALGAAWMWSKR